MLRLPSSVLDVKTAKQYLGARSAFAHREDNIVILDFGANDDSGNWADDGDGSGLLSLLIALRADIAAGDHRALYLGWLSSALRGDLGDNELEPPRPSRHDNAQRTTQGTCRFSVCRCRPDPGRG